MNSEKSNMFNSTSFIVMLLISPSILPYTNALAMKEPKAIFSSSPISQERSLPAMGIIEYKLVNGINVCLKPTAFDDDEVLIHGFAPGGFALVEPTKRASAQLAAAIAWESGIGSLSSLQVSRLLYDSEVEIATYVGPFCHSIEGVAPPERLPELLRLVGEIFTAPKFSKEAMPSVIEHMKQSASHHTNDAETRFEDVIKAINSGDLAALRPLTDKEISAVDFQAASDFYHSVFLNPSGLTFVIVGSFDPDTIKPLVAHYLGNIPAQPLVRQQSQSLQPVFPQGIRHEYVTAKGSPENLTQITFSLSVQDEPVNMRRWETATQVLEARLRRAFVAEVGSTQGIDVALELPLHPICVPIWLTLQFRSSSTNTERLVEVAVRELQQLQKSGPTQKEVQTATELQQRNDLYWERDNGYWLSLLSNYYQLGMALDTAATNSQPSPPSAADITEFLRKCVDPKDYTVVTLGPQKG